MCDGRSWPSWTISSARSVSCAVMPAAASASLRPISSVTIDLTLTASVAPVARTRSDHDAVGLDGVAGPVHHAAARGDLLLQLLQVAVQVGHGPGLDGLAGVAQRFPVRQLTDHRGPLGPDGPGRLAEVAAQLGVGQRPAGRDRERLRAPQVAHAARRGGQAEERGRLVRGHRASWGGAGRPRASRPGSRPGARSGCPVCSRDRPPPMCIRQELSPAVHTSAWVVQHAAHLVGQHGGGGVRVLDRERAAEAAAGVGVRQLDQVDPGHVAQQPERPVADPQQPQRVAGRMVGDPVRVVGADVLHAEHVDQQLGQFVGAGGHRLGAAGQRLVPVPPGHHRVLVPDRPGARAGRGPRSPRSSRRPRRSGGPGAARRAGSRC